MLVLLLALLALVILPRTTGLLVDFWWFRELGFEVLFTRTLVTRLLLFTGVAIVSGGLVHLNLAVANRGEVSDTVRVMLRTGVDVSSVDLAAMLRRLARPVAIVVGLFIGAGANVLWDTVLQAWYQSPFGTTDAVFGRDIAWYVFTLPALSAVLGVLTSLTVLTLLLLVVVYYFRGEIELQPGRLRIEPAAGVHLSIVLAVMFVLWAVQLWFVDTSSLLFSTTGPLVGASYTDLHATLPALRLTAVVAVIAAGVVIAGGVRHQLGFNAVIALAGYFAVSLVGRSLVPSVMQKFVVAPTELTREEPYLAHHPAATRRAWGIDSVEVRDLGGEASLTLASIRANAPTIDNVRLWDRDPLLRTFGRIQEIRTYYDFVSVDDDRYWIDGRYRQVLLAPRELNSASLPTRTFINEHLTFTHGMGLTLSPVNQVTPEGLPVLFVKDLPPSTTGTIRVTRPQMLRRAHRPVRVREDEAEGVRLSRRRREHLPDVRRDGGRAGRERAAAPHLRGAAGIDEDLPLGRHERRHPHPLQPEHRGAREEGVPLPPSRPRSIHGGRRGRDAAVDAGRVHGDQPVSVLVPQRRRHVVHPQQRQDRHRRLSRHGHPVRVRAE